MDYEFQFAREQAAWVASDRVGHMSQEQKASLLNRIDLTLEQWKLEQVQPDGTIAVDTEPGDYPWPELLGTEPDPLHIPADHLRPEQCAGPLVESSSDLFTKLWADNYAPIRQITSAPAGGHDIVMALLVERDGDSMPTGSLASALHYIWKHVWASREEFRKKLTAKQAKEAENMAEIRTRSAESRAKMKRLRTETAFKLAVERYIKEPSLSLQEVAAAVYSHGRAYDEFKGLKESGIRERIKGAKQEALRRLSAQS